MSVYVSKQSKKEEEKSTACTFLPISVIGFLLLALYATGIFPVRTSGYQKILICVSMGIVLLVFFLVGIVSLRRMKTLGAQSDSEQNAEDEILSWFCATYPATEIDAAVSEQDLPKEALYFKRYEVMVRLISEKYPDLEEDFLDHLIEELYAKMYAE